MSVVDEETNAHWQFLFLTLIVSAARPVRASAAESISNQSLLMSDICSYINRCP